MSSDASLASQIEATLNELMGNASDEVKEISAPLEIVRVLQSL